MSLYEVFHKKNLVSFKVDLTVCDICFQLCWGQVPSQLSSSPCSSELLFFSLSSWSHSESSLPLKKGHLCFHFLPFSIPSLLFTLLWTVFLSVSLVAGPSWNGCTLLRPVLWFLSPINLKTEKTRLRLNKRVTAVKRNVGCICLVTIQSVLISSCNKV